MLCLEHLPESGNEFPDDVEEGVRGDCTFSLALPEGGQDLPQLLRHETVFESFQRVSHLLRNVITSLESEKR